MARGQRRQELKYPIAGEKSTLDVKGIIASYKVPIICLTRIFLRDEWPIIFSNSIWSLPVPILMPAHGYASIQSRPCMAYMRTCIYLKEALPEDDAERGTEGRVFETLETIGTRTSLPREIRGRGKEWRSRQAPKREKVYLISHEWLQKAPFQKPLRALRLCLSSRLSKLHRTRY